MVKNIISKKNRNEVFGGCLFKVKASFFFRKTKPLRNVTLGIRRTSVRMLERVSKAEMQRRCQRELLVFDWHAQRRPIKRRKTPQTSSAVESEENDKAKAGFRRHKSSKNT